MNTLSKIVVGTIGLISIAALATSVAVYEQIRSAKPATRPTTANGRYSIVFSPNVRADTFLLDTRTGDIWRQVAGPKGQTVWQLEEREARFNPSGSE